MEESYIHIHLYYLHVFCNQNERISEVRTTSFLIKAESSLKVGVKVTEL